MLNCSAASCDSERLRTIVLQFAQETSGDNRSTNCSGNDWGQSFYTAQLAYGSYVLFRQFASDPMDHDRNLDACGGAILVDDYRKLVLGDLQPLAVAIFR